MGISRNDPCPCGSGKKYKRCCLAAASASTTVAARAAEGPRTPWSPYLPLLILLAGLWAYQNSFVAPFVLDDRRTIVENLRIQDLGKPWQIIRGTVRPVTNLTLAFNYALGGLNVWGYHLVNWLIHVCGALTLFGIIRRTLLTDRLRDRYGESASSLALAVSLLWVVHPLQTQAVTYIIQRAESLMALWYLLTLYGVVRGAGSTRWSRWHTIAVVSCALGMATKPIMATAPLLVFLYGGMFLASSWRDEWRRRWRLHGALASTWGILAALLLSAPQTYAFGAGFTYTAVSPLEYARTQPGVILHYLRLAGWPHPLVLDYLWPVARTPQAVVLPLIAIGLLLVATALALSRRHPCGFLGAWFFVILAPTSSIIPIADLAVEHRVYLPLAAIAALAVFAGWAALCRAKMPTVLRDTVATSVLTILVVSLGAVTMRRNDDYRDGVTLWAATVAQRPENPRARCNLALVLGRQGKLDEAKVQAKEALRLKSDYAQAHDLLGTILDQQGRPDEALAAFNEALRLQPDYVEGHGDLGALLAEQGKLEEAMTHLTEALRLAPTNERAHNNLGIVLAQQGKFNDAIAHFIAVLRVDPDNADARRNLDRVRAQQHQERSPSAP